MSRESAGERSQLLIRAASENDVETILSFIQELAEYEQLAHLVEADAETLHATLFSDTRYAEVVIAECDTRPAGFALFFHSYSTFMARPGLYLEDLYVKPDFRGRGIGGRLLSHLGELACQRACGRLEFSVLNWNAPAIDVYEKLGAQPMNDWTMYRFSGPALRQLANRYPANHD